MPELLHRDRSSARSRHRAREPSPDSVIFTPESNFSLFSSASASVERCSFASDAHDRDSFAADISLSLGNHFCDQEESSSGPGPHPNKIVTAQNHGSRSRKGDKVGEQYRDGKIEAETKQLDSARSSFSIAVKECQLRKSKSEALAEKLDRQGPDSLDLNNAIASSPRLESMKKISASIKKSGVFPSPGTPSYRYAGIGMQKGWSSERVASHTTGGRRQSATLFSYTNERILPSKWEDAERWILSPVARDSIVQTSSTAASQRRPKSKSGPLGPPGLACYSLYSPAVRLTEGRNMGSFIDGSPFQAGFMGADGVGMFSSHGAALPIQADACMARSVSIHGYSETCKPQLFPPQDESGNGTKDAATNITRDVSRRDMATQMSPDDSGYLSPERKPSSASISSAIPIADPQTLQSSKTEVRDLQVDESVLLSRWSKSCRMRNRGEDSGIADDWSKAGDPQALSGDGSETAKSLSNIKREEARIIAWENLQKAKAEAAIRKLEMKLEKSRASSMNKITKKLKSAQKRAQEMRSSLSSSHTHQVPRSSHRTLSISRIRRVTSWSACFTCRVF